jgi:hypothetical protein
MQLERLYLRQRNCANCVKPVNITKAKKITIFVSDFPDRAISYLGQSRLNYVSSLHNIAFNLLEQEETIEGDFKSQTIPSRLERRLLVESPRLR